MINYIKYNDILLNILYSIYNEYFISLVVKVKILV